MASFSPISFDTWMAAAEELPTETDQNLTARSTRFGNGRRARIQSRTTRKKPSVPSTPTPRVATDVARKHDSLLPRSLEESSLTKTEPQLPRPSETISATRHATSKSPVQQHVDMPVCLPGTPEAQTTATLLLPEVPNLTELVAGVYDNGTPNFSDKNKGRASRFSTASQAGENTNRISLLDAPEATPKYDEKKLLASIRSLENQVAELQHHQAESEHTIHYLRQKAFEAESKGRSVGKRSDSALGSISGGSDGEDKSAGDYRKLMIEKNRIESRLDALNEVARAYQDNLNTVTQERDSAVSQLGNAYLNIEQLKQDNQSLQEEIQELREHINDLIAYQEESSIPFEADPDMSAKDAECDRIMEQREQAANTRQRIKASLRARQEQVTEPIPDLPPCIFPNSDDNRKGQLGSSNHQEPKVTIDDVSLELSYQSNIPGTNTGVRHHLEGHKVDDSPSQMSVHEESVVSHSQQSTPDRWAIRSISTPQDQGSIFITSERVFPRSIHMQKDAGEQSAEVKSVDKVTSFPMIRDELKPPKSKASVISSRNYHDDRSDVTSAWVVPDISIGSPEPKEQSIPEVSESKGEFSGGEHSGSSQSTVERALRQFRTPQPSLLDDNSGSTAKRVVNQSQENQRALLDDNSKAISERSNGQTRATQRSLPDDRFNSSKDRSTGQTRPVRLSLIDGTPLTFGEDQATQRSLPDDGFERSAGQTPATQRSLLDYDIQTTGAGSIGQVPTTWRSLLDDDSQSVGGFGSAVPRIRDSLLIAKRNLSKNQPALPSLPNHASKSVVMASDAQQKTKKTKVVRKPVAVSDRMPVPGPYEEEPTMRPSQHPGIALATVLGALEAELAELKRSAKKYQQLYDDHDAALSKRSRKNVFEKLQRLNQTIDTKADHIYSLYDVLEGQKQCGQEMSQDEIEVTLQSIGIDPEDIPWEGSDFTGTHSTSSSRRA